MQKPYRVIPSSSGVSALQSRSKDPVHIYATDYGHTLDEMHMIELIKPQLYLVMTLEPIYVRNIRVSRDAITKVTDAHSDVYIVDNGVVYIDSTIYGLGEIAEYTQRLLITAYKVQKDMKE